MAKQHFRDNEAIKIIATNVRKYRQLKGISMETLADLLGLEYSVIARLELTKSNPSVSLVFAIAKALEIKPVQLLE